MDKRKNEKENSCERNKRNENRKRAKFNIIDSSEESQIREYANIQEIKEMNNLLFYKELIKNIVIECVSGRCNNLCFVKDRIDIYDNFKEGEDIFVKMGNNCVWLKKSYMDATAINITNVIGTVNMIGYILEEENQTTPKVIKALAIYT